MKTALVCGAGGFIGSHLVKRLKRDGYWVRGADLKYPDFGETAADEFAICDLREQEQCRPLFDRTFDEVYQLAADMGGAGYLFTGDNDAEVMHNSVSINLNVLEASRRAGIKRVFYSSSACVYPEHNQEDPDAPITKEDSVYPAFPDSEYGWEKLFSERLFLNYNRNHAMECRIARYHNIFGPEGTWTGGKEKVPAAMCRKVAEADEGGEIEIWGDGKQTRSFLFVDDCIEATLRLTRSDTFEGPVNIGSEEAISINDLARLIAQIAGKNLKFRNVPGPEGVRGRNSHNDLVREKLGWQPELDLQTGLIRTYPWISRQVEQAHTTSDPVEQAGAAAG